MAEAMENELALLIGLLPDSPDEIRARRVLLVAIARGVLRHLRDRQTAIHVDGFAGVDPFSTTPTLDVKDL
jgi:hypothetical protein